MIDTDKYEKMTYNNDYKMGIELEIAVGNLLAEVKRLRELADNLYDFAKWMQDEKRKDPIGLQVLKDRMYWRNEE